MNVKDQTGMFPMKSAEKRTGRLSQAKMVMAKKMKHERQASVGLGGPKKQMHGGMGDHAAPPYHGSGNKTYK